MKIIATIGIFLLLQKSALAIGVGLGGYVPFGLSTQSSKDGGKATFSMQPTVYVTSAFGDIWNHVMLPEVGYIKYTGLEDDYTKSSLYFLADVGYKLNSNLLLRYGFGFFTTTIGGDGKTLTLNNGNSTAEYYQPKESTTTYNTTVDLGVEYAFNQNFAFRFESFWYGIMSSVKRDVSYMFSLTYYL